MADIIDFPVDIRFSLAPVLQKLEERIYENSSAISKDYMKTILEYAKGFPELWNGLSEIEKIENYKEEIHTILENIFIEALTNNEIKAASIPFSTAIFNPTVRFEQLLKDAGPEYAFRIRNMDDRTRYIFICIIILNEHYKYNFALQSRFLQIFPIKTE